LSWVEQGLASTKHIIGHIGDRFLWVKWASVTKTNSQNCKNCLSKCAYDCAHFQYTVPPFTSEPIKWNQTFVNKIWLLYFSCFIYKHYLEVNSVWYASYRKIHSQITYGGVLIAICQSVL